MRIVCLLFAGATLVFGACSDDGPRPQPSLAPDTPLPAVELPFDAIGILSVSFETGCEEEHGCCGIPEGCGPKFKLEDEDLQAYTPLIGQINEEDWDRLIGVRGTVVDLPESEYGIFPAEAYKGPRRAIEVESYTVLGRIRYHGFLVASAGEYVRANYPCLAYEGMPGRIGTKGNKEMGWQVEGSRAVLVVRMVDTSRPLGEQPYLELRYDANTGEFVRELTYPDDYRPCD